MSSRDNGTAALAEKPPFPASHFAMVLFGLSQMLDSGKHDDISLEDVKAHAKRGDLIKFLTQTNGGSFATGFFDAKPDFAEWYTAQIADNCAAMSGRERRKYAIERRGLCLLISYTAELLQGTNAVKATP